MPNKTRSVGNSTADDADTAADLTQRARDAAASMTDAATNTAAAIDTGGQRRPTDSTPPRQPFMTGLTTCPVARPSATLRARPPIDSAPALITCAVTTPSA